MNNSCKTAKFYIEIPTFAEKMANHFWG